MGDENDNENRIDPAQWEYAVAAVLQRDLGADTLLVPRKYLERALEDVTNLRELARFCGGGEETIGG